MGIKDMLGKKKQPEEVESEIVKTKTKIDDVEQKPGTVMLEVTKEELILIGKALETSENTQLYARVMEGQANDNLLARVVEKIPKE